MFLRIALSGLREAVTKCKVPGRRGIFWDLGYDEYRRKLRTRHWFWGCKFAGSKENSQEDIDLEAAKCQSWRESPTLVLMLQHVSFGISGLSVGEAAKSIPLEGAKSGCNIVLHGRRDASCYSHASARVQSRLVWQAINFTLHVALHTPHSTLYPPSTLYTSHLSLHTLHSALCTVHSTLYALHSSLYTPHGHTLHPTLYS